MPYNWLGSIPNSKYITLTIPNLTIQVGGMVHFENGEFYKVIEIKGDKYRLERVGIEKNEEI